MLFSSLCSVAQDEISSTDTIIYPNGKKVLVYVLSVKSGVVEYKKVDNRRSIFFIPLSSIKELVRYDGRVFSHNIYINTLDSIQRVNDFKRDKIKDSLRARNREKDSLKRTGHLILTSNLVSFIHPNEFGSYSNGFASMGILYYPSSNFSIGVLFNLGLPYRQDSGPILRKGLDLNAGFSSSKRRHFDLGFRAGVAIMELNHFSDDLLQNIDYKEITEKEYNEINAWTENMQKEPITTEYNGRFFEEIDILSSNRVNIEKSKKINLMPYLGLEFNYKIDKKFSLNSMFGFKYDIDYWFGQFSDQTIRTINKGSYYDFNDVWIADHEEVYYLDYINQKQKKIQLIFRLSVNYHFFKRKR